MPKENSQLIRTIKKVMPAVVSVVISKSLEEVQKDLSKIVNIIPGLNLGEIPPDKVDAEGNVQIGGGSGFLIDKKGIVLTNRHVVSESNANYSVVTSDGEKYDAKILARDPLDDIAILKIDTGKRDLPILTLGSSDDLDLGQTVIAFGNALGIFQNTVSSGIVSGLARSIVARITPESPAFEMRGLIQTDAAINPGNSGGPLTDIEGNVIGINAAVIAGAQNIGFAIPIKLVERDLAELKRFGKIRRPFFGIRYITLDKDGSKKLGLSVDYGALVMKEHAFDKAVVPGSPAEKAGIKEKDVILEWNGEKITPQKNIQDCLAEAEVGDKVELVVLRNGKRIKKNARLAERK